MDRMLFNNDVTKLRNEAQNLQPQNNMTMIKGLSSCYSLVQTYLRFATRYKLI